MKLKDEKTHSSAEEVAHVLSSVRSALIVSHKNPEADALGSQLALHLALEKRGLRCFSYNTSGVPEYLQFLPGSGKITSEIDLKWQPECVVVVDSSSLLRGGDDFVEYMKALPPEVVTVNVDHHVTNEFFARYNYVLPEAPATGFLVYEIVKHLRCDDDLNILKNIYAAILADTGNFSYSNTSAEVLELGAELVRKGVSPHEISSALYANWPYRRMKLLALALDTLEFFQERGVSVISIFRWMYEKSGAKPEDTEDFVNFARDIKGVRVAFLIREVSENLFKISIRSRDPQINAAELARKIGGGGHIQAAGAEVEGEYGEIKNTLLKMVP